MSELPFDILRPKYFPAKVAKVHKHHFLNNTFERAPGPEIRMTSPDYASVASHLSSLQSQELSILRISEPISLPTSDAPNRSSDVSTSSNTDNPSPASLAADLTHYKELFSKLRFSYLEQVTKEKFLRAIVGEPPQIVEHQENVELEAQLAETKAELKAQKLEVQGMVEEIEDRGRDLARRM